MGSELRRMIRDGAPPTWTPLMRLVACEIADDARDPDGSQDGLPWSAIPIQGHRDRRGRWRDGLTERTGMSARAISRVLTDLAAAGYEMREIAGRRKDGRAAVTAPGRALRFRVPLLQPRPAPERSPDSATERSPDSATIGTGGTLNDRHFWHERSPLLAITIAEFGDPIPSGSPHGPLTAESSCRSQADVECRRLGAREASPPDLRTRQGTEQRRQALGDALTEWQREHEHQGGADAETPRAASLPIEREARHAIETARPGGAPSTAGAA